MRANSPAFPESESVNNHEDEAVINWKIHRRRRLIFAFLGLLFGIWFVQTAIVKYDVGLLVHNNPPGTPVSKTKAYVRSHGWFQGSTNSDYYDNTPQLHVFLYGSRLPWLVIQDTFHITFKIDSSQHVVSVTVFAGQEGL